MVLTRANTRRTGASRGRPVFVTLLFWITIVSVVVAWENFSYVPGTVAHTAAGVAPAASMAADPSSRALKLLMISVGGAYYFRRRRLAHQLLRQLNRYLVVFLALALASAAWSADSTATIARFVGVLAGISISFAFCVADWQRRSFQQLLAPILTALLLGSLVFGLVSPQQAIDANLAGWHGLAAQKNPFGMLASFGVIICAHGWMSGETPARRAMVPTLIACACLVLSRSVTSLLATALTLLFFVLLMRTPLTLRRYSRYFVVTFAIIVLTYALAVLKVLPWLDTVLLGPIVALTGKDLTFSNRSAIWAIVQQHIQYHPLLGTGFGAYWTSPDPTSPSYEVFLRLYFWPSESHNGYLEMINDLGYVGLAVLIGYLITYVHQALKLHRLDRNQGALFLGLFFQQAVINLSESTWLAANGGLAGLIMNLATFALARALLESEARTKATTPMPSWAQPRPSGQ